MTVLAWENLFQNPIDTPTTQHIMEYFKTKAEWITATLNKLNKNLKKKRMIIPLTVIISPVH